MYHEERRKCEQGNYVVITELIRIFCSNGGTGCVIWIIFFLGLYKSRREHRQKIYCVFNHFYGYVLIVSCALSDRVVSSLDEVLWAVI